MCQEKFLVKSLQKVLLNKMIFQLRKCGVENSKTEVNPKKLSLAVGDEVLQSMLICAWACL
jgi:hypothetical protein